MKKLNLWLLLTILLCSMQFSACSNDDDPVIPPGHQHTEATKALIKICNENDEIKSLLEHAIAQAAEINPDRQYNPAQSLNEFYDFIDWNVHQLPWNVMIHQAPNDYGRGLYGRTDQGIGYFWFIVDQPLDELRNRGFFYPTVEFVEPFASWLSIYSNTWGEFLSTEDSWNDTYYNMVKDDPDWGLTEGWYGEGNQWRTFNEFFARKLASPAMRPIADTEVVCPVDSWPKLTWQIDDNNQLQYPDSLQIKTAKISDIAQLIGNDSQYKNAFAGGTLTHTFLDVNCYHRYHAPVDGVLKELRTIPGVSAGGGYTLWDNNSKLYYYVNDIGFQMVETRACAIIETEQYGLVAMMPVGMSQICSVNWLPSLQVGQQLKKGDEMGFFQFGGSDVVMIFQKGIDVNIVHNENLTLMGEPYAKLQRNE
ncbi:MULTISPECIES: phosphatidylserine decarboxylase [unclassified Prevotella]|uniref:phosphatidylserine decarboxylase n=1 Tax=unclassified Prevotella TaxID=2638335 RepID=UPI00048CC696|nr:MULTISPECIES: phosphatidylserine decarboxylase [unclassified Prevotella]